MDPDLAYEAAAKPGDQGSGRFGVVVPALARMAQQCDVERPPEAVLRAPARTDQIKIIIGQKIVALQPSDVPSVCLALLLSALLGRRDRCATLYV